jgi:heavy metal translocating P-type ATPase
MGAKQTRQACLYFIPALILTIPVVVLAWGPVDHEKPAYAHISLVLATLVQIIAIKEFVPNALRTLWHTGVFEMDFLIALSSTIAYTFSVVSYAFQLKGTPLETGSFFETSTLLVSLILLGRVINEYARYRAAKSVSFRSLQAEETLLVLPSKNPADPETLKLDARLLQYGDSFKVAPHARVVTDGIITYGGSEIDESMITGESIPVAKGVHSTVFAGTTNGGGTLIVRLTALPHENTVHKIAAMVEDAELTKPKAQALADRIAGWFVPFMATLGLLVFLSWLFITRFGQKRSWKSAVVQAITYAIATLVVSCPCAIGLAVPMVVLIAGGVAARFGIIFRDPQKLETARSVTDVVFDKTGTLTCGVLTVVNVEYYGDSEAQVKGQILSLLQDVKHPVAAAILRHLEEDGDVTPEAIININSIPGSGVYGTVATSNDEIRAGSPEWLSLKIEESNCTLLCVTIGPAHVATFKLRDRLRHTTAMVITKLQAQGIQTHMISGDGQGAVDDVAHTLNIPKRNTKSRCKPEGKMAYVKDLQQTSGRVIMFVGDGTNDSVALKQADVGVHINQSSASDVAKSAADVVLMTARLHDVLILLDISRAAYRRIVLNFAWSAFYNTAAILLAGGVFTSAMKDARINPQWAGLGELVSVLPVVLVAFQMRARDYGGRYRDIERGYLMANADVEKEAGKRRSNRSSEASGAKSV